MLSRFFVFFPLVLSLVAFVLATLCLFAGRDEGFMEDYAIARVNTSMLGHNILDSSSSDSDDDDGDGGILDTVTDAWDDIKDEITDTINDITGEIADQLAETLGIHEWYSVHVMDACEGYYKPNATSPGAGLNVTGCTQSPPAKRFNLNKMISKELSVGPFDISLADLDWPDTIDDAIDTLNAALLAIFIFYVLGIGFSGLAMLTCVVAFFLAARRGVLWVNLILAALAALSITVGSIIGTVAAHKGVGKINDLGEDVGLSASVGSKFIALTWVSSAFMIAATLYWTAQLCLMRREKKREWKHRKGSY
ncbi:actin cortical patch SUR7/pH-response regulator pali [Dactylonectria macrodidyma]|uniref:Actin cortical patch SUR7/pH-response regulator pali n=1 Tax=Dactylonectria macrodidyma TaxID=307937 RepID=A0A9P9FRV4_9HYPO|nr:actin cortical patch SUR7/pH-response regulator pali [Dactylonectria macrodidyma]